MARLHRPYIPVEIRCIVAERQLAERGIVWGDRLKRYSASAQLKSMLALLFPDGKADLHHRPALVNRHRYVRNGKVFYDPPANSAEHLVYLKAGKGEDHDIETRVRGIGAQRSDLAQARYLKKVAKNRAKKKASKSSWPQGKTRWPKRRVQWWKTPREESPNT